MELTPNREGVVGVHRGRRTSKARPNPGIDIPRHERSTWTKKKEESQNKMISWKLIWQQK
jgi:hypothetical protein